MSVQNMSLGYATDAFIAEQSKFADEFSRTASTILRSANTLPTDKEMKFREMLLQQKVLDAQTMRESQAFKEYLNHKANSTQASKVDSVREEAACSSHPTQDDLKG